MKTLKQASLLFIFLTIITCVIYPAFVMAISQTFYKFEANGEMLSHKGVMVGSELIAQEFTSDKFFWARPSAANYNGASSSGSNYALTNPDFKKAVLERKAKGLDYDLLTTSGSGLDPHISPKAAFLQIERVAKARNMDAGILKQLVTQYIEPRQLGFLGEERVNVLKLNLGLENLVHE